MTLSFARPLAGLLALASSALTMSAPASAGPLPSQVRIVYDVLYGSSQMRIGRAEQRWRVDDSRFELQTELVPLIGPQVRYVSRGTLGAQGLVPSSFAEYRGKDSQPRAQAEFDWAQRTLRYGKGGLRQETVAETGAQDVNTLPYQLAWLGDSAPGRVQVTTGKKVARYGFTKAAALRVTVNGKEMNAIPLRSVESDGDRTEVWLAPQLGHLPVRVIRLDEDKELRFVAREVQITPGTAAAASAAR